MEASIGLGVCDPVEPHANPYVKVTGLCEHCGMVGDIDRWYRMTMMTLASSGQHTVPSRARCPHCGEYAGRLFTTA